MRFQFGQLVNVAHVFCGQEMKNFFVATQLVKAIFSDAELYMFVTYPLVSWHFDLWATGFFRMGYENIPDFKATGSKWIISLKPAQNIIYMG